jgi:hypothetical protein
VESPSVQFRRLGLIDLVLILAIGGASWFAVYRTGPAPGWLLLSIPLCVTLGFAGVAAHSAVVRKPIPLFLLTKWSYIIAWTAAFARFALLVSGFGTLEAGSAGERVVAAFGMGATCVSPVAAIVAARFAFKSGKTGSGASVLVFGLYPVVLLAYDLLTIPGK